MKKAILGLLLSTMMVFGATVQLGDTSNSPNVPSTVVVNVTTPTNLRTSTVFGLYGWTLINPNASPCFVEVFNVTASNVVLGTTAPVVIIPMTQFLTSTAAFALPIKSPGATSTLGDFGVSIAAVTTPNGTTPCTLGVSGSMILTSN